VISTRISRTSASTPVPSFRDIHRFKVEITPVDRQGRRSFLSRNAGAVLDATPVDCHFASLSHKESSGTITARWGTCGKLSCTWCVVDHLAQRVAPAWAFWGERLVCVIDLGADGPERARTRTHLRKCGLSLGKAGTPGALGIPTSPDGHRTVFVPRSEIALDGSLELVLRREALTRALVEALRSIPINQDTDRAPREPSGHYIRFRPGVPMSHAVSLAEVHGAAFHRRFRDRATAENVAPEAWEAIYRAARSR
jgi:hypothetical protein